MMVEEGETTATDDRYERIVAKDTVVLTAKYV